MTEVRVREILIDLNREHLEVMRAVARGMDYQQIGEDLCLSTSTVKRRVSTVLDALGVESRIEAVVLMTKAGLIPAYGEKVGPRGSKVDP